MACLFLACCAILPLGKQAALWLVFLKRLPRRTMRRVIRALELLAPVSLLEILALAVTLLAFKEFPGGSRISIEVGAIVFWASIVSSVATVLLLRRERQSSCAKATAGAAAPVAASVEPAAVLTA